MQRSCGKCNRSARSLPGAAGPVRPAANTATATVHTTFTPEQIRWAFSESESFDSLTTGVAVISFITRLLSNVVAQASNLVSCIECFGPKMSVISALSGHIPRSDRKAL